MLILLGFTSGLVTQGIYLLLSGLQASNSTTFLLDCLFYLCPGLLFGIFISLYFKAKENKSSLGSFIIPSTISWIAAMLVGLFSTIVGGAIFGGDTNTGTINFFTFNYFFGCLIGGLVGALILGTALEHLISNKKPHMRLILSLLGGLLGVLAVLIDGKNFMSLLFIIWQTGMALGMSFFLDKLGDDAKILSAPKPNSTL